jgi:hypothetical protein
LFDNLRPVHLDAQAKEVMRETGLFKNDPFYEKHLGHQAKTLHVLRCLPDELNKVGGLDLWLRQVERFITVGMHVTKKARRKLVLIERFKIEEITQAVVLMLDPNLLDILAQMKL